MYSNRALLRGGRQKRAGGCTLKIWANPQPASNASPLHGSRPGVAEGCGQCCGTRQRCKSTAARAGGEPAISSGSETLSAAATRWQERAKMTDASENTPHWTAGGGPRTVPSALSPGAARRAGRPHHASRPARAPARSSWHGGVCQTTGRAWLAARGGGAPLPRYTLEQPPQRPITAASQRPPTRRRDPSARAISSRIVLEAGSPRRTRSHAAEAASASDPTNAAEAATPPPSDHGRHPDVPGCTE